MALQPPAAQLLPGFREPVTDAQRVFRVVMQALSRPALPVPLALAVPAPPRLTPEVAAILLALADNETSVWLEPALSEADGVRAFLAFHTGARITPDAAQADYVVAASAERMPALPSLKAGTPEYPDRSATLIVPATAFATHGLLLQGPGIDGRRAFGFSGMPATFAAQLDANRAQFPCGVDIIIAAPGALAALPRSVRVLKEA